MRIFITDVEVLGTELIVRSNLRRWAYHLSDVISGVLSIEEIVEDSESEELIVTADGVKLRLYTWRQAALGERSKSCLAA